MKASIPSHAAPKQTAKSADAKPAKEKRPVVTVIPAWKNPQTGEVATFAEKREDGTLRSPRPVKLRRHDFPNTTDGRRAYCQFEQARWGWMERNWAARAGQDPQAKINREIERLRAKLAGLEAKAKPAS